MSIIVLVNIKRKEAKQGWLWPHTAPNQQPLDTQERWGEHGWTHSTGEMGWAWLDRELLVAGIWGTHRDSQSPPHAQALGTVSAQGSVTCLGRGPPPRHHVGGVLPLHLRQAGDAEAVAHPPSQQPGDFTTLALRGAATLTHVCSNFVLTLIYINIVLSEETARRHPHSKPFSLPLCVKHFRH